MTSSHRHEIDVDRWPKPVRIHVDQRMCTTYNILEDEFHFIMECCRYNDLRSAHIKRYFYMRPHMYKFLELVSSTNYSILKNLALCVKKAFKQRQAYVFQL